MSGRSAGSVRVIMVLLCLSLAVLASSCGTTKQNMATEQMLNSDAVDSAVARIDFTPLAGQSVFFETKYMVNYKGVGFVNADYVISSLRQQMAAAGVLMTEKVEDASLIAEGRVGTLGTDAHEIVYGIPSNSALGTAAQVAASAASGVAAPASIPELSLARRNEQSAAAKIGIFAYDRVSREVVWQSGSSVAKSTAKDLWVFGVGPFQRGSIYSGKVRFAGEDGDAVIPKTREGINGPIVAYGDERIFRRLEGKSSAEVVHASGMEPDTFVQPALHGPPAQAAPSVLPPPVESGDWAPRVKAGKRAPAEGDGCLDCEAAFSEDSVKSMREPAPFPKPY